MNGKVVIGEGSLDEAPMLIHGRGTWYIKDGPKF